MSRTLTVAGLPVDSWRDQSPQTEPSEMNQPQDAIQIRQLRGTSDDAPSTPRLLNLVALGAVKWESR